MELNDNEMSVCPTPDVFHVEFVETESHMVEVEITLYALLGSPSPGTIRIKGKINGYWIVILLDTSNTNNFLDAAILSNYNYL